MPSLTREVTEPLNSNQIQTAVIEWARRYYHTEDVVAHIFHDEDDDPERYIAILAVRSFFEWQAAEVWLEDNRITVINDLGEGLPPDDVTWPWSD